MSKFDQIHLEFLSRKKMDLQFPYAKNQAKLEKLRCNNFAFAPKLTFLEGLSPVVDQELFSKNVDNEP